MLVALPSTGSRPSRRPAFRLHPGREGALARLVVSSALGLASVLAGPAAVTAGVNVWTSGGPPAGEISSPVVTPGAMYVVAGSAVFKTVDHGATWTAAGNGLIGPVYSLVADPADPATLYAGTLGHVARTTNGGTSWVSGLGDFGDCTVTSLAVQGTVVYAGAASYSTGCWGVYKSVDRGSTWTPTSLRQSLGAAISLAVDPTAPGTVYAAVPFASRHLDYQSGVFKTADGGATWSGANTGLPIPSAGFIVVDPSTPTTLYTNFPTDPGVFLSFNLLFQSVDGAAHWAPVVSGLPDHPAPSALVVVPGTPIVLVAGAYGVYASTDRGAHWSPTGLVGPVGDLALDLAAPALYATVYDASGPLLRTSDAVTWVPVPTGQITGSSVTGLVTDATNPDTVYAGTRSTIGLLGGVFKSSDGGTSWGPFSDGLPARSSI